MIFHFTFCVVADSSWQNAFCSHISRRATAYSLIFSLQRYIFANFLPLSPEMWDPSVFSFLLNHIPWLFQSFLACPWFFFDMFNEILFLLSSSNSTEWKIFSLSKSAFIIFHLCIYFHDYGKPAEESGLKGDLAINMVMYVNKSPSKAGTETSWELSDHAAVASQSGW